MKFIITRPESDAIELKAKLEMQGHDCRLLPLLKIVPRRAVHVPAKFYQAICITSANAVVAPISGVDPGDTPLYCVGPQSAAAARAAGFQLVEAHGGDVNGLAVFLENALSPAQGPVLYLSGAETSGDLEGRLKSVGFTVDRFICYDAVPQHPEGLKDAVSWAEGVLLYSPRTARLWVEALNNEGIVQPTLRHFCLSDRVAAALPQSWGKSTAQTPDEFSLLARLDQPREGA